MTFDLGCAVGDIDWAPYSSTIFAAVSSSGQLYLYDLHQEKHHHLCEQSAMKKAKGLHVSFNPVDKIIVVGDDRGGVTSFILPSSLKKGPMQPDPKNDETHVGKTPEMLEIKKMDDFLSTQDKVVY